MNMTRRRAAMIVGVVVCMAGSAPQAVAAYGPWTPITNVSITGTLSDGDSVAASSSHTMTCTPSTDNDCDLDTKEIVSDPVTHTWSGPGTFDPTTGGSVTWTAPSTIGNKTITVTANDSPLADETAKTDSISVTVVKVSKIQYNDPDTGYTDVTGTMYVMQGTTVTFKAIPDPAGASWPSGKPAWGGTSGASGSGATKAVTFDTLSSSTTDYKTVTAECGNTVTVNVIVYSLTGYHVAQDNFSGRATTTYGVAEDVDLSFTVSPTGVTAAQMGGLKWTQQAGSANFNDDNTDGLATYDCHWYDDSVTLRLTVQSGPSKSKYVDMGFTVIKPDGADFIQKPGSGIWHVYDTATVGFLGWKYLTPKTVSFADIDYSEGSCDATLNGWFAAKYPSGLTHPEGSSKDVGSGNSTTGCRVVSDDMVATENYPPPDFSDGYFTWVIPWRYSVGGGGWTQFTTATHRTDIDASGKTTIQKKGVGPFSKNFSDASSSY